MSKQFLALCEELTNEIKASYEKGIGLEEAERLAGKFLYAQLQVGEQLRTGDLNARMRKTGLKAVKAAVYMDECTPTDEQKKTGDFKKPTEAMLTARVDLNVIVQKEQDAFDTAEVERDALQNYLNVFKEAHIHFRSIAKGRFE